MVKDRVIAALKQQRFAEKMKKETELLKKKATIKIEEKDLITAKPDQAK
jgi:hypothetical protein